MNEYEKAIWDLNMGEQILIGIPPMTVTRVMGGWLHDTMGNCTFVPYAKNDFGDLKVRALQGIVDRE